MSGNFDFERLLKAVERVGGSMSRIEGALGDKGSLGGSAASLATLAKELGKIAGKLTAGPIDLALPGALDVNAKLALPGAALQVDILPTVYGTDAKYQQLKNVFEAIHFDRYDEVISRVFFATAKPQVTDWKALLNGRDAYDALEVVTDLFLKVGMSLVPAPASAKSDKRPSKWSASDWQTAWLDLVTTQTNAKSADAFVTAVAAAFGKVYFDADENPFAACASSVRSRPPCDLLHPFFAEIGGVRQAENALLLRYQNQRVLGARGEALVQLNIEANDSLNAWLKGRLEAYQQRRVTSLAERANDYFAQVGVNVVPEDANAQPAEVRTGFMPALLEVVRRLLDFYAGVDDKMIRANATRVFHALKELQLKADEAEANRAFDMPFKLRKELLVAVAILGHPTLEQNLVARTQVRRAARYQAVVEAVKESLGWELPDIALYQDLAFSSEILVAIGQEETWTKEPGPTKAEQAAIPIRDQATAFAHAYRTVAGVDLSAPQAETTVFPESLVRVPGMKVEQRNGARMPQPAPRPRAFSAPGATDGLSRRIR
jgi:hypothetical protein